MSDTKLYQIIVLPRVMFERFSEKDYSHVLMYESARDEIADLLVRVCKDSKHKFDGIVLEVWFQLAGRVQDRHLLRLVEHLGKRFLFHSMKTVFNSVHKSTFFRFNKLFTFLSLFIGSQDSPTEWS